MTDYTPTTETVRERFADGFPRAGYIQALEDFDRWLAAHDAEVRAGVVVEEPEWEYGLYDPATNDVDTCGTDPVTRESFTGVRWEETGEYIVRRRVAGPWEPVKP